MMLPRKSSRQYFLARMQENKWALIVVILLSARSVFCFSNNFPIALNKCVANKYSMNQNRECGEGVVKTFHAGDVLLQSGRVLQDAKIVYEIHGSMNQAKSNIILHPTSFGAQHTDLRYRIGPGKDYTLDTTSHCVVVVNMLGNGASTSPSQANSGQGGLKDYPWPSMTDNAILFHRLLREELACDKPLDLIFGYSIGAMAALHFACRFPTAARRVAAVCGTAKPPLYNRVFLSSLRAALHADPTWDPAAHRFTARPAAGLRAFGAIYAGWGLSPEFYRQEEYRRPAAGGYRDLDDFIERSYVTGFADGEPHDLLAMLRTWDTADPAESARGGDAPPPALPHPPGTSTAASSTAAGAEDLKPGRGDGGGGGGGGGRGGEWDGGGSVAAALGRIRAVTWYMPCRTDRYFTPEDAEREAALMRAAGCPVQVRVIPSTWGHRAGDPYRPGQEDQMRWLTEQVWALLQTPSPF